MEYPAVVFWKLFTLPYLHVSNNISILCISILISIRYITFMPITLMFEDVIYFEESSQTYHVESTCVSLYPEYFLQCQFTDKHYTHTPFINLSLKFLSSLSLLNDGISLLFSSLSSSIIFYYILLIFFFHFYSYT